MVKEFKDKAKNTFHMYQADRFLELARENLNEQVSDEIVEEIREVRRRDKLASKRKKEIEYLSRQKAELNHLFRELEQSKHKLMAHEKRRHMLQQRMQEIETVRNTMRHRQETLSGEDVDDPDLDRLMNHYSVLSEEYSQVRNELDLSSMEYKEMQEKMMSLERGISHRMKIIEQENPADS